MRGMRKRNSEKLNKKLERLRESKKEFVIKNE